MNANILTESIRRNWSILVDQAQLVSRELIRIAILWHEMWHAGIEEASRLYYGENNIEGMISRLSPLHEMIQQAPKTHREISFMQIFGKELNEAGLWLNKYKKNS